MLFEREAGPLFEVTDKLERTCGCACSFDQNVDVIRHQAIGVDGKVVGVRGLKKSVGDESGDCGVGKVRTAVVATDGQEIDTIADVIEVMETRRFAVEHGYSIG